MMKKLNGLIFFLFLTAVLNVKAAEGDSVFGKVGNIFKLDKNQDQRTSIPVHVKIRTILSQEPTVYATFGDFIRNNTIAGVEMPIGKKANKGAFELTANETERSVNVNRVPAHLQFSFNLPEESTTSYIVSFPSSKIENVEITVVKKSVARWPESTHTALFKVDAKSFENPTVLKSYLPQEHQFMNDYVHPWRIKVEFISPTENAPPEYFIEVSEIDPSEYLKGDELVYWNLLKNNVKKDSTKFPSLDSSKISLNPFHISALHLAVRFKNIGIIRELLSKETTYPWRSMSPTQGVPFVMAVKYKDTAIPFLEAYKKLSPELQSSQSGLEIGFGIEKTNLLDLIDEKMANEFFLKQESYGNLIKYLTMITSGTTNERLINVLSKISHEKRSTPFYLRGIFFWLFRDLADEQGLLVYYETKSSFADRVAPTKIKIKNIINLIEKILAMGVTPTPMELFEHALFMIERKDVDKFELKKKELVTNLSKLIFSQSEDFERYYSKAQSDPKDVFLKLQKIYMNIIKKESPLKVLLIEEQKQFFSRPEGHVFDLEGIKFVKKGNRFFLKELL